MQSKSIEEFLDITKYNLSSVSQLSVSNHGIHQSQLRSLSPISSLNGDSCTSKFSKNDYLNNSSHLEDATTIQCQSNQVWQDEEMTFRHFPIQYEYPQDDVLLTSMHEGDKKAEFDVNPKKKSRQSVTPLLDEIPNEVLTQILSYLPASSITVIALVSRKFNTLVMSPHVWRAAFSRGFQGSCKSNYNENHHLDKSLGNLDEYHSELRLFNRLTTRASWRSEFILRTRLLHNLERGKPNLPVSKINDLSRSSNKSKNTNSTLTFSSHLTATISHINAAFDSDRNDPRFIHGASETSSVTISDSANGKIGKWRLSESEVLSRFSEVWAGNPQYGLGNGPVGVPNSMDISLLHGVIIGEGIPAGRIFYQSTNEMRGRYLQNDSSENNDIGIPRIPESIEAVSAVWVAKSHSIPKMTDGLIGILSGSTLGVVAAYSSGFDIGPTKRIPKGFPTAKWALSPGVPIIAFDIDDSYNSRRKESGRVWAVALNALGEVFYLSNVPSSALFNELLEVGVSERHAWKIGRTVHWSIIGDSHRIPRDNPYHTLEINQSYCPRSSSNFQNLSQEELKVEARKIETYFQYTPTQFRKAYDGWDMQRRLHVDFAGNVGNNAGEAVFVIKCGTIPGQQAEVKRMTRIVRKQNFTQQKFVQGNQWHTGTNTTLLNGSHDTNLATNSIMKECKESVNRPNKIGSKSTLLDPELQTVLNTENNKETYPINDLDQWQSTIFSLRDHLKVEITSSAIDMSNFALLTVNEDPLRPDYFESDSSDLDKIREDFTRLNSIPGSRARFLVVGTNIGTLIIWNMRGPLSQNVSTINELRPFRKIYTDSPGISCVAISALYIVHGGNDGLVQAWDPLISKSQPIRTINSRSSQIRRRLARNETSFGPSVNSCAAGTILLDHNPLRLRGIVSIGTQLRYWSYSSTADEFLRKRRRRPHEHSNNSGPDRFSKNGRGAIRDYINTEKEYFKKDEIQTSRENAHLRGRFGVGICGLTDEEAIRYAELISAEEFKKKEENRMAENFQHSDIDVLSESSSSRDSHITSALGIGRTTSDEFDRDLLEAIRLSILEN
ncbi:putative f-box and wd domain-containing protein [Erysiphe neolycopersici]|uniref:Putative f-box and wd domain-containing protein n=1 Tax=Erysiphe neolycopersici TaxID=212602 RepID=A0A420I3P3_9PEZI|nr:putative f-box and wd domain-containing protein [Erysiphe neolycopersici]